MFSTLVIAFIKCLNRHHMINNVRHKGNINSTSVIIFFNKYLSHFFTFLFMFLGNLTKLPAMVLCSGEPPGFCDVGCCFCFSSLEVFTYLGYFSLPPALHRGFSCPWRPPPALSSTLATFSYFTFAKFFRHSFTVSATVLSGYFLPTGVFYLALLPHTLVHFVTQMQAGTLHLGSSSMPALTEFSLLADAWTWTTHVVDARPLIYQLHQWATIYRVKIKLLNMFCLYKVIWKVYKNTLNKTW